MSGREEWDTYWKSLSWKRKTIERIRKIYFNKVFARLLKKHFHNGVILEAGCGSGTLFKFINKGCFCVGLDYSIHALKRAKRISRQLVLGDIKTLPFKDKIFGIVYNQGVMEHFSEIEWKEILKEFKRVSNKVLIILPSITSIFRIVSPFGEVTGRFFSKYKLIKLLSKVFPQIEARFIPLSFFLSVYCFGENNKGGLT
jgi:ubiquinone/menaquinone biosynthesis C-methylase UbiE